MTRRPVELARPRKEGARARWGGGVGGESSPQGPPPPPGSFEVAFLDAADEMRKVITQLKEGKLDSISFPHVHTQLENPSPKTATRSLQANPLVDL